MNEPMAVLLMAFSCVMVGLFYSVLSAVKKRLEEYRKREKGF